MTLVFLSLGLCLLCWIDPGLPVLRVLFTVLDRPCSSCPWGCVYWVTLVFLSLGSCLLCWIDPALGVVFTVLGDPGLPVHGGCVTVLGDPGLPVLGVVFTG